ncbi:MAG: hypothetical protein ABEI97_04140, partial [Candidatus Nanohaloarchaea archaeon]
AAGVVLGSTVLIVGLGISAIAANVESFPGVFAGFALFVAGYKLSQLSVRDTDDSELRALATDITGSAVLIDLFMTVVGTGAIAYGLVLLFTALNRTDLLLAGIASALMFAGYATAHYGVNKTVV